MSFKNIFFILFFFSFIYLAPAQAWFNGDWAYRHKITLKASQINGDQTDFPVYLDLSNLPDQFFDFVDTNGADIRMTRNDAVSEIAFELVNLDTTDKRGELWFKAPSISSTNNSDFFIYYGNANGTSYDAYADYGSHAVWDNGYNLVSHFNSSPAANFDDNTLFSNEFSVNGAMTSDDLIYLREISRGLEFDGTNDELEIDKASTIQREIQKHRAYHFDGLNDYIQISNASQLNPVNGLTLSMWLYPDSVASSTILMTNSRDCCGTYNGYHLDFRSDGRSYFRLWNGSAASIILPAGTIKANEWQHLTCTYNGREMKYYINTELKGNNPSATNAIGTNASFPTYISRLAHGGGWYLDGKLFDIRIYDQALTESEIEAVHNFKEINTKPVLWYKTDDTDSSTAFDASGNDHHGSKTMITPSLFHYEGNDVPYSFQNSVGYNRAGYANGGEHINIDIFSEIEGGWNNGGTVQPDVGFGQFFGKNAKWVTFTPASATGYAGSRATTSVSFSLERGADYSWSAQVRADRNLAPGESIYVYYTGSYGMPPVLLSSTDDLTSDWLYIEREGYGALGSGNEYLTVFLNTAIASDITLYISEHQMVKASTIDNGTYAGTHGLTTGTFLPRDESKPNSNKDIYNGDLSFIGKAPGGLIHNGSFAGSFDGLNDYFDTGILADSSAGSIKARFITDNVTQRRIIVGTQSSSGGGRSYLGTYNGVIAGGVGSQAWNTINGTTALVAGQEYEAEVNWDGTTVNLYLDGDLEYSAAQSGSPNTTYNYMVGAHNYFSTINNNFNGSIFDVQISNASGLVAHYPIAEGNGTNIYDVSGNNNHGTLINANNGELFWNGVTQNSFHYNAEHGFTRFLKTTDNYPSGITYSAHGFPNESLIEVELDFIRQSSSPITLFNFSGLYPFRINILGDGRLRLQRRRPDTSYPNILLGVTIAMNEFRSLRVSVDRVAETVTVRDLANGNILSSFNNIDFHSSMGSAIRIGRYDNSSASQGAAYYRRVKYISNGVTLSEWNADSNFNDTIGSVNPTAFSDIEFINIPSLNNGDTIADENFIGLNTTNPGGYYNNKSESQSFVPKSIFDIDNGEDLNIQTIFKTNSSSQETLLKKGDDIYGYELKINNGILNFEIMNLNGSYSVSSVSSFNDDKEHLVHVLVSNTNTKIELFVDGQKENETSISGTEDYISTHSVLIARPNSGSNFYSSQMDELRFSNRGIDANWVNTEYNNIFFTGNFYLIDNGAPMNRGDRHSMFWGGQ